MSYKGKIPSWQVQAGMKTFSTNKFRQSYRKGHLRSEHTSYSRKHKSPWSVFNPAYWQFRNQCRIWGIPLYEFMSKFEAANVWDWLDHQPKLPILNTHFIPFIANSPQTEAWDSSALPCATWPTRVYQTISQTVNNTARAQLVWGKWCGSRLGWLTAGAVKSQV